MLIFGSTPSLFLTVSSVASSDVPSNAQPVKEYPSLVGASGNSIDSFFVEDKYTAGEENTEFTKKCLVVQIAGEVSDENLTRLLQTQISGILYDEVSPSAIVNLNGVDQFVKIGDTVAGYTIESITKDKVQITYKNNTYVASVGELFTRGVLEKKRAVADLENKFAGRYRNNN